MTPGDYQPRPSRTSLASVTLTELAPAEDLTAFLDPQAWSRALRASEMTVSEEVSILASIMRDAGNDPSDRMRALEMLYRRRLDVLRLTGHLAKVVATEDHSDPSNVKRSVTAEVVRIAASGHELIRGSYPTPSETPNAEESSNSVASGVAPGVDYRILPEGGTGDDRGDDSPLDPESPLDPDLLGGGLEAPAGNTAPAFDDPRDDDLGRDP